MTNVFLKIVNMSLTASLLMPVVFALRLILQKAPKWVNVLLWGLVAIRLVCPFSIESSFSLVPKTNWIGPDTYQSEENMAFDSVPDPIPADSIMDTFGEDVTVTYYPVDPSIRIHRGVSAVFIISCIWLAGMGGMLIYMAVSYLRVHQHLKSAKELRDNIFTCDGIESPFVFGFLKPRICLPSDMEEASRNYVIAHEQAHICRRDHWWKPLGFLLLTVHWFNPLMWLAYILLCRDIEMACDERVVRDMSHVERADYSQALLACSIGRNAAHRPAIAACPLAFGEVGVKQRIKSVLNYKKPAFWVILIAVVLCIVTAVCFLTNPQTTEAETPDGSYTLEIYFDLDYELTAPLKESNDVKVVIDELMNVWIYDGEQLMSGGLYQEIKLSSQNFDTLFDNIAVDIGLIKDLRKSIRSSWIMTYTASENGHHPYLIIVDEHEEVYLVVADHTEGIPTTVSCVFKLRKIIPEEKKQLTLDDVIALSAKGEDLTWEDFAGFQFIETGSGLYIRIYEIDENFELWIGGGSPIGTPMYIRLKCKDVDVHADVTKDDVAAFIEKHTKEGPILYERPISYYIDLAWAEAEPIATAKGYGVQKTDKMVMHNNDSTVTVIFADSARNDSWSEIHVTLVPQSDGSYAVDPSLTTATSEAELQEEIRQSIEDAREENRDGLLPYTIKITRSDLSIYTAPGYDHTDTGVLLDKGTYTITEEFTDYEGIRWGKLQSGAGWIDLDKAAAEAPHIPITMELTNAAAVSSMDCHIHIVHETDYTRWLLLQAYEPLTDIRLTFMDFTEDGFQHGNVLYSLDEMTVDKPLVVGVVFYGDFTVFGLTFTDAAGMEHCYRIYESGRNGSVVMQED